MSDSHPAPTWLSASKARKIKQHLWFVAAFSLSFEAVVRHFAARVSTDREIRGNKPFRYFFLQLTHGRIAMITNEMSMRGVSLYLHASPAGEVDWEDFEQVTQPLGVPVEEVFLQGGLVWQRNDPRRTSAAISGK